MFIAYLASGFVFGLVAAIMTLVTGSGALMAFGAYVLFGMLGTLAAVIFMPLPQRTARAKQSLTQYN